MVAFLIGAVALVVGYFTWGALTERAVAPDPSRPTPAVALADGVDYVAMPTWRVWLVELLNIAGLGPVFGPILGAVWGPQVFLWVVLGCILGGAVHDLLAGAMSTRRGGAGLAELIGHHLGEPARHLSTFFVLLLMVLVGTVFVKGPALLLVTLLPAETAGGWLGPGAAGWLAGAFAGQQVWMWLVMTVIFGYYVVATLLPIDAIIGRLYPFFAAALLVMVGGLTLALLRGDLEAPRFTLGNLHPGGLAAWPVIFITVSCGAVSGFHGTQAPLMARCITSERRLRWVFYGAMIAEGFIALVWAAAAQGYYGGTGALAEVLGAGGPGRVVHEICTSTMGLLGGALAILGVVVLPVTSGDTAFRVGRLILAEYFHVPQRRRMLRVLLALPLFAISIVLNFVDFTVIWRYFGWANQTLAAVTLWTGAVWLARRGRWWWLAALPAAFMTAVTTAYLLSAELGFGLSVRVATLAGCGLAVAGLVALVVSLPRLAALGDDDPRPGSGGRTPVETADGLAC